MMTPSVGPKLLPAKSARPGQEPLSLRQHSFDTEQAAHALFRLDGRLGRNWCKFFEVAPGAPSEQFLLNLRVAALLHDLGKANEDFVAAVTRTAKAGQPQSLRHEHISALVLQLPAVQAWLRAAPVLDLPIITAAVLSHHTRAAPTGEWKWCQTRARTTLPLYLQHPEVVAMLERIQVLAGLGPAPALPVEPWSGGQPWLAAYLSGLQVAKDLQRKCDRGRRSLLLAVKAGVIVADAVSSGLVREGHSIEQWIGDVVHAEALSPDRLQEAVLAPREGALARQLGKPFRYQQFQAGAANLGPRALLLAGCGSGKTLAAWRWAQAQLHERDLAHVVFLYPTKGTATEGFRDYVAWAPETEAALVHGSAKFELEAIRANPRESEHDKNFADETNARLFALALWSRRYFSATVDQFLAFLEHRYESLCLLPVLANSAVVIDEVHSFDRHMFDNLVSFLGNFDIPVLCMTATLPASRRAELEAAGLRVYPGTAEREALQDLERLECSPRYRLTQLPDQSAAMAIAVEAVAAGRRVLWVVNTVDRCQRVADELERLVGQPVLCYHSRYRGQDRRAAHQATVRAFQQHAVPAVAVTTQVCEMSLDLDADVLLTELAPPSSLVQRFGRAHRKLRGDPALCGQLYVYEPVQHVPYQKEDLVAARTFLGSLPSAELNQRQLAVALEAHARGERTADGQSRFLTEGMFASPGDFREGDDFSAQAVLDTDLPAVLALLRARAPLDDYALPVPRRFADYAAAPPELRGRFGVAAATNYLVSRGFIAATGGA